jgi:hypothetical protein
MRLCCRPTFRALASSCGPLLVQLPRAASNRLSLSFVAPAAVGAFSFATSARKTSPRAAPAARKGDDVASALSGKEIALVAKVGRERATRRETSSSRSKALETLDPQYRYIADLLVLPMRTPELTKKVCLPSSLHVISCVS